MTSPIYWQPAREYLASRDQILEQLMRIYPNETLRNHHNPFYTLTRAIIGQQISVKAAEAIWNRFAELFDTLSPETYLQLSEEKLRQCGLSRQKITYIGNISQAFQQELLTPSTWSQMSDQEVTKQLMAIRGIGIWTAQMFLIFHLHRPNILPLADIGLINAIQLHYGSTEKLYHQEILQIAEMWQPFCTVATWYLWRSLDPVVVQY
jgi:DNA-3-methyladenine glycosylase II